MRTASQLIHKALAVLKVLGGGQDAPAEDYQTADDALDPLLAELAGAEVVYIADRDAIPDEFYLPLAVLLANAIARDFEREVDPIDVQRAESRLRALQAVVQQSPIEFTPY